MELKTKYITPEDFKAYTGIDLEMQLEDDDNPSNRVNAFLLRVETRMETFINANFFKSIDDEWTIFSDYQKKHYKIALLEQALYVFKNSDISTDSGYDPEKGIIADRKSLRNIEISDNARSELILCGLWNRHIKATRIPFLWR